MSALDIIDLVLAAAVLASTVVTLLCLRHDPDGAGVDLSGQGREPKPAKRTAPTSTAGRQPRPPQTPGSTAPQGTRKHVPAATPATATGEVTA